MKKLLTLALMLVMVIALVGCSLIPENIKNAIFGSEPSEGTGEQGGEQPGGEQPGGEQGGEEEEPPHVHEFLPSDEVVAPTCEEEGYTKLLCSCGEFERTDIVPATGHSMKENGGIEATCSKAGIIYFKCENCRETSSQRVEAYGHEFGASPEASRLATCTRDGCSSSAFVTESNGTYTEKLTFNFTDEDKAEIAAKHAEIFAIIEAAPEYDPALHAYAEEGALAEEYAAVDAIHTEYYDLVLYVVAQYQISMVDYYCDMDNTDLEDRYSDMMDYYTQLIADFYSLSQPIYDSCYREFFYYGMTEPEIKAFLFDSSAVSDPEYMALKTRNDEIELEFFAIADPTTSSLVPTLYSEFVQNSNRMAEIMGYANYLEYSYQNVYDREYTYQQVAQFTDYVAKYITPSFKAASEHKNDVMANSGYKVSEFRNITQSSFFSNLKANTLLNDYIDIMSFNSNPDKVISFSDEFNGLMQNGNLFRGEYSGAFVTYFSAFDIPIAYFSSGYDNSFTIAHEFGHYMNEVYNRSEYSQSYDLLEVHSQGNEMLYLSFLNGKIDDATFSAIEADQLQGLLSTVMLAVAVDSFEQAIYLDSYDGAASASIMADGTISANEYDALFSSILSDLGVAGQVNSSYWRYGMTISSPCYYISYAVSALSAIQIYEIACTEGFDAARDAYLNLFTYTDTDPDLNYEEVLLNAGMKSYNDEEFYISLYDFFIK